MKSNYTDVSVIIDRSGSMDSIKGATIEGFNRFVEEQKSVPGEGCWTLVQFDDSASAMGAGESFPQYIFEAQDQAYVPKLTSETYRPRGGTALIDAVCKVIDRTGQRLAALPDYLKPGKVLLVIMTDGEENCSREFNLRQMHEKISHQRSKYNWQFVFLGANQDAIGNAQKFGMNKFSSANYDATSRGVTQVYRAVNRATRDWKLDGNSTAEIFMSPCDKDPVENKP